MLGFIGVVVLLRPGTDAFPPWSILPIIGAAFYALAHITTRVRCQETPLSAISLAQNIVMMSVGLIVSALLVWTKPDDELVHEFPYVLGLWSDVDLMDSLVLVLLAGFIILISVLLAGAYQAAPPAIISTFEYSYLVFVAIWDILFLGITPTFALVAGMTLIVIAGLLVLRRGKPNVIKYR